MNIKSLLIGSAAALAVVSGAQAADAVVAAEPEPMEYVRVCDAYGTGFFYIPGTETCLKIGGQLRFEKRYSKAEGRNAFGVKNRAYYDWHTRARLNIEARNDSEWGTVYSWLRLQNDNVNNTEVTRAFYYFGIGGLEFGRYDSPGTRFHGYGGRTDWGGDYANEWDRQYVSYTATFDSVSAFIALENDLNQGSNYQAGVEYWKQIDNYTVDSNGNVVPAPGVNVKGRVYMPDVSAGIKGTFGDYEAGVFVGYDESLESFNVRKWVRGDIGMFGFTLMGLYSDDARNSFFMYDGFSGILGLSAKVTDTVTVAKDIQWWDDDSWRVIGNVNWEVATGFSVLLEASYGDGDSVGNKVKTGMLRFQRSF